jgi:deoxyribodipyrimidine photo-lyase
MWFRLDLRIRDNPSLLAATTENTRVLPLYIWSPGEDGHWSAGAASRWWLHQSLDRLDRDLQKLGARLIVCTGDSLTVLRQMIAKTGARSLYFSRRHEPHASARDHAVQTALLSDGIAVKTYNSHLLFEPSQVQTKEGKGFRVFTPFWNHCLLHLEPNFPIKKPKAIILPDARLQSLPLAHLKLQPKIDWTSGIRETWTPGEKGAQARLKKFINGGLLNYAIDRDRPNQDGVSMISPHLHFGEISPRQVWHAIQQSGKNSAYKQSVDIYLKEIGWREFAHHILFHFPSTTDHPLREQFKNFPWSDNLDHLRRWQKGQTGYPIVDAGMRQLWQTGWMHNRVRMIVASFLTKDLLISWTYGAQWFWDTLVDADLASNTLGWQWAAGCGADAAPYFRIFNPQLQGEKFDPHGAYVRRWVPELGRLPAHLIHKPWQCSSLQLQSAGVELGHTYPKPVVDHSIARRRALSALAQLKAPLK